MTVWSPSFSIHGRQRVLTKACLYIVTAVIITTAFFAIISRVSMAAPKTIGFSAKLRSGSGAVVPDGSYNIGFKLYKVGNGGSPVWGEDYFDENGAAAGEDFRVKVTNGHLSVKLGSRTAFDSGINWSDDLWLTMNIGGTSQIASVASIPWDGEMSPRIQLSATPYSMDSGAVGGKTADQLVQIGQGMQVDASDNSSIAINKTGSGKLIQLQSSGTDVFSVETNGHITLGAIGDQSISVGQSTAGIGHDLSIAGGAAANGDGGTLVLQGGKAGLDGSGGGVIIDTGDKAGSGGGGSIALGSTNASGITIGNSSSTTIISGNFQSNSIDTSSNSSAIEIGQNNAASINLGQNTQIADGKTLSVNGDTTIKSSGENSQKALQVQNVSGASQLTVDTLNSRVNIGSHDADGTLLVLDNKTSSGDPVGTNGSMYYNADQSKFRCFEAGAWKDCITPLPVSKVIEVETSNSTTTAADVSDLAFQLTAKTKYYYKFMIIHEADEETTGIGFGVTTPTGPKMNNWCVNTTSNLGSTNGHWGSYCGVGDASATTNGEIGVGQNFTSTMEGYLETGDDAGNLTLRFKSESNNKTTLKPGSFGILQIVQ